MGQAQNLRNGRDAMAQLCRVVGQNIDVPHLAAFAGFGLAVQVQARAGHGKHTGPVRLATPSLPVKPYVTQNIEHGNGAKGLGHRSEESRGGKEWVSPGGVRVTPYN